MYRHIHKYTQILLIAATIALFGCATSEKAEMPAVVSDSPKTKKADKPPVAPQKPAVAVTSLLGKAERQRKAKDYKQATTTVERALRIAPEDPLLWQKLAEIKLDAGDAEQAEAMSLKSNEYAGDEDALKRRNWSIVYKARRLLGDREGARKAQRLSVGLDPL